MKIGVFGRKYQFFCVVIGQINLKTVKMCCKAEKLS